MNSTILYTDNGEIACSVIYDPLCRETILTDMLQEQWISDCISWDDEPDAELVFDGRTWDEDLIQMFFDGHAWDERAMDFALTDSQQKRDDRSSRMDVYS